ncbi:MAG: GNAT family N-acetyltransferase [Lachnospiraceae bacterium]|nr:GNAT family N-acetyltransferase [Lachnospiraceae bacterium]
MGSKYLQKSSKLLIEPTDETDLWEKDWEIKLKRDTPETIGTISFAGEKNMGMVPIKIELQKEFRNRGFGTEALKMMTDWAFYHRNIYEVSAVTGFENDPYIHALEKAGFVYRSRDKASETEVYTITKQPSNWTGLYIAIGVVIGLILGLVFSNLWLGMAAGVVICSLTGLSMDVKERKEREDVTGMKKRRK